LKVVWVVPDVPVVKFDCPITTSAVLSGKVWEEEIPGNNEN